MYIYIYIYIYILGADFKLQPRPSLKALNPHAMKPWAYLDDL